MNWLYRHFFKRFFDIILSFLALVVLSPLLLVVSLLIRTQLGKPVLFQQNRLGKNNKEFKLLKFRSMTNERDANGVYLPDDQRITKLGRFIRTTSIDELPSLLNIIKGDMSIIGPRPLPVRYLERYTKEQLRRHEVRPGLSNVSVVNGRNAQSWDSQFQMDVWYVDHMSIWVDIKSIFDTVRIVISHKGATADDGDCREEFIGTADIHNLKTDSEGNYMKIKEIKRDANQNS